MKVEQLYTKCLSEASYYIESNGEAIVIDPIREPDPYLEMAQQDNAKIKYVLETHFHADFVSGHIDLAKSGGGQIVFGPNAQPSYDALIAKDGQELKVGNVTIKVLHTPGHTPESTSYLLIDEEGNDYAVFTGDTLFVGDVGRPDLAVKSDLTKDDLAGMLYDSLNTKLKTLADEVIVYPGHGAGSACGKNIGKETFSTIGEQKKTNYAMKDMPKDKFIEIVTEGLMAPPAYFFEDARINKEGYTPVEEVMSNNVKALTPEEAFEIQKAGALILDTRAANDFGKGFPKGAMNIGLGGQYALWAATLIKIDRPIIVLTEEGKQEEAILRLARVGYENVKGYISGGFESWEGAGLPVDKVESVDAKKAVEHIQNHFAILDVRKPTEFQIEHLVGAANYSLQDLDELMGTIATDKPYVVHCKSGYRSMIASSILKAHGVNEIYNVLGGYDALAETTLEKDTGVCPTQLLKDKV